MTHFPRLASRVFNRPLLVDQRFAQVAAQVLAPRMGLTVRLDASGQEQRSLAPEPARSVMQTKSGVRVIPIVGALAHRGDWIDAECGGVSSYTYLHNELVAALDDDECRAILLDIDSPGGEAGGCFEFADSIVAARARKPVWGVANAQACSAAYAIGSSCERFFCTPSGEVGSIGVVCLHVDMSGAIAEAGLVTTFVFAGAHKIDGNPFEPLPKSVKADFQRDVNASYEIFVNQVAARRGLSAEAVRGTEARVYRASDALELGLIDEVASFQTALVALEKNVSEARAPGVITVATKEAKTMTTPTDDKPIITEADVSAARAESYAAGRADAVAIMSSPAAEKRQALAAKFAADASMSVTRAAEYLAEAPEKPGGLLAKAMESQDPAVPPSNDGGSPNEARKRELAAAAKAASAVRYIR